MPRATASRPRSSILLALSAVLSLAASCDKSAADASVAATEGQAAPTDPSAAFEALEARLADQDTLGATCTLEASGAVDAQLEALLALGPGNRVNLTLTGTFGDARVDTELAVEGDETFITRDGETTSAKTPPAIREAVAVGMTRMGLMHNAAVLIEGGLPDHADGGVREWVDTTNHRWSTPEGDEEQTLDFDLVVAGGVPASANLLLDGNGLPARRLQEVQFSEGTMSVTETCQWQAGT